MLAFILVFMFSVYVFLFADFLYRLCTYHRKKTLKRKNFGQRIYEEAEKIAKEKGQKKRN